MRLRRGYNGWWIALAAAVADRITKAAVYRYWDHPRVLDRTFDALIPGVVNIKLATNRGMAFSMLSGQTVVLTIATALLIAGLLAWLLLKPDEPKLFRAGLWLIVGGGLGNLYDRVVHGYVIDFIELTFVRFAVFNVADACICVGAALAAAGLIIAERRKSGGSGNGAV